LSRSREFLADAGSVELTKNPDAMISALRKIEGRGELAGATSAVMEMCVDNPREEFADLFATHPSIEQRVDAIVKFAGGHDPGPLALPGPAESPEAQGPSQAPADAAAGPWGGAAGEAPAGAGARPFLPPFPPGQMPQPGAGSPGGNDSGGDADSGPWGPHHPKSD
jgi:heat shock protein HtpX